MPEDPTVWVYTRAYNAEKTIRRTIESVLGQSYKNIRYTIRDNGSTDNTYQICREYAECDPRIKLVHNKINNIHGADEDDAFNAEKDIWVGRALQENDFACFLDADDEYKTNFFENAVDLSVNEDLDIVMCGVEMIDEESRRRLGVIIKEQDSIIDLSQNANMFPIYHWYMRQIWGKLFRKDIICEALNYQKSVRKAYLSDRTDTSVYYGSDTLYCLSAFAKANRIGILNGIGHRWYIQKKSESSRMSPNRSESDRILYYETKNYIINKYGQVNNDNLVFITSTYLNSAFETLIVIKNDNDDLNKKIGDVYNILSNNLTKDAVRLIENISNLPQSEFIENNFSEINGSVSKFKWKAFELYFKYIAEKKVLNSENAYLFVEYFPSFSCVANIAFITLLADSNEIFKLLLKNDFVDTITAIAYLIYQKKFTKKYDLEGIIKSLSSDDEILHQITENTFIRKYYHVYALTAKKEYTEAVEKMTEILNNGKEGMNEKLVWLYLTFTALLGRADDFVFGKFKAAQYYFKVKQYDKCKDALKDLEDMGVEDNDEINKIRYALTTAGK